MAGPHAVIVGAGPAGCLTALYLARRGYKVDVYEKRVAPVQGVVVTSNAQSYPMILATRATKAFEDVQVDLPCASHKLHPYRGFYFFQSQKVKTTLMDPQDTDRRPVVVDRHVLATDLLHEVQQRHPDSVHFHFQSTLEDIDLQQRVATFRVDHKSSELSSSSVSGGTDDASGHKHSRSGYENGSESSQPSASGRSNDGRPVVAVNDGRPVVAVAYDLLVGADGASSRTREVLQASVPSLVATTCLEDLNGYKTFHDLAVPKRQGVLAHDFNQHRPKEYIYVFTVLGTNVLIMWLTENCTASGIIVTPPSWDASFLEDWLANKVPKLPQEWLKPLVAQISSTSGQPARNFGRIIRLSQFHGPRAVLLGDAAHAMTSALGQGCNTALESVRCFIRVLDDASGDLDKAPAAFTSARRADAHAMQELEFMVKSISPFVVYPTLKGRLQSLLGRCIMVASMLTTLALNRGLGIPLRHICMMTALRDWRCKHSEILLGVRVRGVTALLLSAVLAGSVLYALGSWAAGWPAVQAAGAGAAQWWAVRS